MKLLYIDLFCGAGGTSTGVNSARLNGKKCAKVIACVNHDKNAIASHAANHPDALHFTEDIRTLELSLLVSHVQNCRRKYPDALVVLWASLECTNFSKAKGGKPRDADSRTLAEHLFRYIETINPDYIQIENVEEFMSWGDIDEKGKPISMDKGKSYIRWVQNVKSYGYTFDHRILNAADYGAYTSRKRFFGIFAKHGLPIVFPEPTHNKNGDKLEKWKPVKDVLDFDDDGNSIFNRKKDLSENTLERIYAGLIKFVAGGKDAFIVKYNSVNKKTGRHIPPSIDEPCPTVATQNRLGLAKVQFLSKQFSGDPMSKNISVDAPAGSITGKDHHAFISVHYGNGSNRSCEQPAPTLTTKDKISLVSPKFILNYRFKNTGSSIDEPSPTICTVGQIGIASCKFIANEYSGGGQLSDIDNPSPAILTTPKQKVVTVRRFLLNPQYKSAGGSIDAPCFTLIARMDKMPPYLVTPSMHSEVLPNFIVPTNDGYMYCIYDTDSPIMVKIKEFMALYGIEDITMRMLKVSELKLIMGFPEDYVLVGTQAEQKKYIGNAVHTEVAKVLCESLVATLYKLKHKTAA